MVRRGNTTFTPVAGPPGPTEVQLDPIAGTLGFASALPNTGTVQLEAFVGTWDETVERFRSQLAVDVYADSVSGVDDLSRACRRRARAGARPATTGLRTVEPIDLGPIDLVATIAPGTRHRRLTYDVDFEHVEAVVRTSGGPIASIGVNGGQPPDGLRRRPSAP